ncbi:hypothetical protein QTP88_003477 [Uroleucon formosanum]
MSLSNNDEIRISVLNMDSYTLPCESYIYIEEIQKLKSSGVSSCLKAYCSYTPNDLNALDNAAWDSAMDSEDNKNFMSNNVFTGCIPLKHLFGFCEDYKKILLNCNQQLILNRASTNLDAIHVVGEGATAAVDKNKKITIELTKMLWKMPIIKVSDKEKLRLLKLHFYFYNLETNHTNVKDKPIDYFIRLRDQLLKNKNFIADVTKTANEKATEASYMVSYRIAQVGINNKYQTSLEEDLLLCQPLSTYTTGYDIFNMLNNFFEIEGLTWDNCIDICTDGAKAMVGKTAGVILRIKEVTNNCSNSHCILHRQALAIKKMPIPLKNVLDEAVKIINFVKSRPLSTRLFTILCEDMGKYEEFIEMTTDSSLKTLFDKISLRDFWCSSSITNEYQSLAKKAILALLPYATTYLCETGFSSYYASTKTKYCNKLDAEADMRIQLSPIKPNIKILVNKKSQHHGSHQ